MSNPAGTIETVALELSKVLKPLTDDLAPGRARIVLASFGIKITPAQESMVAGPLSTTVAKVTSLITQTTALITAIEAENLGDIISKGAAVIKTISETIKSFDDIKNGLSGAGVPNASQVPEKLLNYLLNKYIEIVPGFNQILQFLGVLESIKHNVGSVDLNNPPFTVHTYNLSALGLWLSEGGEQLKNRYDWGKPTFDGKKLFAQAENILSHAGVPILFDETLPNAKLDLSIIEIAPKTDIDPKGLNIKVKSKVDSGVQTFEQDEFKVQTQVDAQLPIGAEITLQPNGSIAVKPPPGGGAIAGSFLLKWIGKRKSGAPFIIIGQAGASRFEIAEYIFQTKTQLAWNGTKGDGNFLIESAINGGKIVVDVSSGDGFIQKLIPIPKFEADFDIGIGVSSKNGVYFKGSGALEIQIPTHIQLAFISLERLTLALKFKDGKIPIELGANLKAELGPLVVVVQNIGISATFSFPPDKKGNLGFSQLDIGFKPPNGVGLSLDAGGFKGGGFLFLDPDKGEYFGALELDFNKMFSVKAIGLINTKMPDGSKGFSMLILITAEFTPIQLGFGFTLNGVGGIFGLNRTMRVSALQEGIKTNAIKSILFPENVVANINRIISDIKQFFPPQPDHFIVGPMAKLGWGTPSILTVEIGLLLDLPEPIIVIVGVIKAGLPTPDVAILRLQVNFIGVLDFKEGYIFFRADLYDSYLLAFNLTGSLAFLVSWGTQKTFAISIGGFHPDFRDIPSIPALPNGFRNMDRLGISLLSGDNPRLRVECYFAITTNTVQFGAKVELYAEAAGFNVYGYLGFDVLFQFDPFMFIIKFYAGLALRSGSSVIASIDVRGTLSGPTPWDVSGDASLTILFFEISVGFHVTWGDPPSAVLSETEELRLLLERDFADIRNWRAELPPNNHLHVSIKELPKVANQIVVHPAGVLTFSQRTLPLKFDIQKYGNKKSKTDKRFEFKNAQIVHPSGNIALDSSTDYNNVLESFAANQFEILSDDQKLSRKSFEDRKSGFILRGTAAIRTGKPVAKDVDYELIYLKKKENKRLFKGIIKLGIMAYNRLIGGGAVRKSVLSKQNNRVSFNAPPEVVIEKPKYAVANVSDMKLHSLDLLHDSEADAYQAYNKLIKEKPELAGEIQIVNHFLINDK